MHLSNIKTSNHNWEKQNLVTISRSGKTFDEMVCKNCGMKGKRYGFINVEVSEKYTLENVNLCPKSTHKIPETVKVTNCEAFGNKFSNLIPGSIHAVVEPPNGYLNDHTGVWVMGVGERVKLLTGEFVAV